MRPLILALQAAFCIAASPFAFLDLHSNPPQSFQQLYPSCGNFKDLALKTNSGGQFTCLDKEQHKWICDVFQNGYTCHASKSEYLDRIPPNIPAFKDSKIAKSQIEYDILTTAMPGGKKNFTLNLLYRGSKDGWGSDTFHRLCDD